MAPHSRPPPLLISSSHPATPISTSPSHPHPTSQSPFRYVKVMNEKNKLDDAVISDEKPQVLPGPSRHYSASPHQYLHGQPSSSSIPRQLPPFSRCPSPLLIPSHLYAPRPRALR